MAAGSIGGKSMDDTADAVKAPSGEKAETIKKPFEEAIHLDQYETPSGEGAAIGMTRPTRFETLRHPNEDSEPYAKLGEERTRRSIELHGDGQGDRASDSADAGTNAGVCEPGERGSTSEKEGPRSGSGRFGKISPLHALKRAVAHKGLARFLDAILKRVGQKEREIESPPFDPGPLSIPSLMDSRKELNITYAVDPPFQYVHIEFDKELKALVYSVREPRLSRAEEMMLAVIQHAFEKQISTNLNPIFGAEREEYLKSQLYSICDLLGLELADEQKKKLFFHLKKSYLGYGRIDTLMKDKYIEDISCNGPERDIFVMHRIYGSIRTDLKYGEVELNNFVLRLAQIAGRHISLLQPIRDVSLPDGSRANLTLGSEVTRKGSTFTIRKFRSNPISPIELMDYGTVDASQLAYLWILMEYKRSIIVSGGTATGKTTFLNCLCSFIPTEYKIVSIEDTAELNLMHPNWIQSVTRSGFGMTTESGAEAISGVSGVSRRTPGDVSLYDLLVAALRQRPEYIIVGEVRGHEAFTLFQAIAVGHAGLGTIHAGSMDELLARVESNPMCVPRSLFSNIDAVVFPTNIKKGDRNLRRISSIVEVVELDRVKGDLVTNTVFRWNPETDVFRYNGRSYLFEKIKETYGIGRELLMKEWVDRTNLLLWLQKKGIRDYREVLSVIRDYYRDKAEVEECIKADIRERLGM